MARSSNAEEEVSEAKSCCNVPQLNTLRVIQHVPGNVGDEHAHEHGYVHLLTAEGPALQFSN